MIFRMIEPSTNLSYHQIRPKSVLCLGAVLQQEMICSHRSLGKDNTGRQKMEYREERPEWAVEGWESFSEKTCAHRTTESDPRRKTRGSLRCCPSSNSSSSKEECQSLCASVKNDPFQEARKVETQVEEVNGQNMEEDKKEAKFIISLTNMLPKFTNEIPPKFAGVHDKRMVNTWIFKIEQYLDMIKVKTDRLRINIATAFFDAFAAEWWRNRMDNSRTGQESPIVSWEQFVKLMEKSFVPTEARVDTQVQKLKEVLRQTETIPVYIMAFLSQAKQLENSNEAEKVCQFIQGLKPKPSAYVRTLNPLTLAEAINLAEKWEQANLKQAPFTPYEKRAILRRTSQKKAISKPDRPRLHKADCNIQYSYIKSRRLSECEKNEYRKRGLCFKCGEHGHTFYQCSRRH